MKIERITVCNIASLAGTHSVDFTQQPLKSAGLFSISGATGAGKSTLLDALCLALFDQTPRLQIARSSRAELNDGEKQNDTRMLLRRNTAQGFAEVAFVGIDCQRWTARWSVRRSRNSVDGKLQAVEMTLFEGHIPPGGVGKVAEGGKKTLVKEAIVERIGLTFEQFTRAVLLAQNDFATFLKATDQERAAILQALTGTERFEQIGRAVFARYAQERDNVDALKARLQGHQPLTDEERSAAEAALTTAAEQVTLLESRLSQLAKVVAWFEQQRTVSGNLQEAQTKVTAAIDQQTAASNRQLELQHTEAAAHQARGLRQAEQRSAQELSDAQTACETAQASHAELTVKLTESTKRQQEVLADQQQAIQEQEAAQPLLTQARELDARLPQLQRRLTKASEALQKAEIARNTAQSTLQTATNSHQQLLQQQQQLQTRQSQLLPFAPFASEVALWLQRLDNASAAEQNQETADRQVKSLQKEQQSAQQRLTELQQATNQLRQKYESAEVSLKDAEAVCHGFDAEQLVGERLLCDSQQNILTDLHHKLRELNRHREEADAAGKEHQSCLKDLQEAEATYQELNDIKLPRAEVAVETARAQLEHIMAAVDDDAQRLRLSLQTSQPCPVCGACEHPYSNHPPDADSTAIMGAREFLKDKEQTRDNLKTDLQKQQLTISSISKHITTLEDTERRLQQALSQPIECPPDHPDIVALLSLPDEQRTDAVQQQLRAVSQRREKIAGDESRLRTATRKVETCRQEVESIRGNLETQRETLASQEKNYEVLQTRIDSAVSDFQKAGTELQSATDALGGLFSGLPNSKDEFAADPILFRKNLETAVNECRRIDSELATVLSDVQQVAAKLGPLQEAEGGATDAWKHCGEEHESAKTEHDQLVADRQSVFEGQPADVVEQALAIARSKANAAVEDCRNTQHALEKQLAATDQIVDSSKKQFGAAEQASQRARAALTQWLNAFEQRTQQTCTRELLDQRLARDSEWITNERQALQQLDEAVTRTKTTLELRQKSLAEHELLRPTDQTEAVVLETVQQHQEELKAAKEHHELARDAIRDDNQQRQQNAELTTKLHAAQAAADPWAKLNELIGSKEGDRFRMIAQRRTLDVLLTYANQQLHLLSARYRLERAAESLNLSVIDCDMGEDRRSIHSLSGGESFLVSLALALGLASLTSSHLPIESLFIDEGFGSLDPETLTTAMNALTHLEAQGRKVGVISHVTEMTDAIPVQIRVEKQRKGGASRLVIPGADPAVVHPQNLFESPASKNSTASATVNEQEISRLADSIEVILKRELASGNSKVSLVSISRETGCRKSELKAAQLLLGDTVTVEGRSLRLTVSEEDEAAAKLTPN